jgi:hypothetical protein
LRRVLNDLFVGSIVEAVELNEIGELVEDELTIDLPRFELAERVKLLTFDLAAVEWDWGSSREPLPIAPNGE